MRKIALRLSVVITLVVLFSVASWADETTYDANKVFPIAAKDWSCWIASAANMLAADGWNTGGNAANDPAAAQNMYNALLNYTPFQQPGPQPGSYRGGFQNEALQYAINGVASNGGPNTSRWTGYDADEQIDVYNDWRQKNGTFSQAFGDTAQALLDKLMANTAADGGDSDTDSDPVGIAFHNGNLAHAVTAWSDTNITNCTDANGLTEAQGGNGVGGTCGAFGQGQLTITDSDDSTDGGKTAFKGTMTYDWVDANTLNYNGNRVTVDYMSILTDGTEPDHPCTVSTSNGCTTTTDDQTGPDVTPEPGTLLLVLAGLPILLLRARKFELQKD